MPNIDQQAAVRIQPEMLSGESVYWAGMPDPESGVLGYWGNGSHRSAPSLFMALWGIPFIVIGQYMIWGRFLHDAWLKRRTYYGLTNRRVLVVQEGLKRKINWMYLEAIPGIEREGVLTGTLWFGTKLPILGSRGQKTRSMTRFDVGAVPVFVDINDVDGVQRLVMELREKARKESHQSDLQDSGPLSYPQNS